MIYVQFDELMLDSEGASLESDSPVKPLLESEFPVKVPLVSEMALENAADAVLKQLQQAEETALSLVITGDQQVRELNRQYLGIDENTDVLAFPAGEVDPDEHVLYLGDVIISYPRALQQAAAGGHSVEAELQLLVVHGVLHLLGYDHLELQEKALMWSLQDEILTSLDCPARPA